MKDFKASLEQIKEAEEAEKNLPDRIKRKIQKTFLQNVALRVSKPNF